MENNVIHPTGDTGNGGPRPWPDGGRPPAPLPQQTGQMIDQARSQAVAQLARQKDRAAGSIGTVAAALRQTGQHLREQHQDALAPVAEGAAEYVERFSRSLQDQDIGQMMAEVDDFARRQPALFLGGVFALGFLATRFLKSSRPNNTLNELNVPQDFAGARGRREYASSGPFTGPAHDLAAMRSADETSPAARSAPPAGSGFGATTAPGTVHPSPGPTTTAAPGSAAGTATAAPGGTPAATDVEMTDDREFASSAGVGGRSNHDE